MRIVTMHARYTHPGGEDVSHDSEVRALREAGHEVWDLVEQNSEYAVRHTRSQVAAIWRNSDFERKLVTLLADVKPDILYVNNTFPFLGLHVHAVARAARVPSIQVLRNYRLVCVAGTLFREGHECRECIRPGSIGLPGAMHGCYQDSKAKSFVLSARALRGRLDGGDEPTAYLAVSDAVRRLTQLGRRAETHSFVRPNLYVRNGSAQLKPKRKIVAYVGRDTPEKGFSVFARAMRLAAPELIAAGWRIQVLGDVRTTDSLPESDFVEYLGQTSSTEVERHLDLTNIVVVPSLWEEPFGRVVIEALGCGALPIVSAIGGLAEFSASHVQTFSPGDAEALARQVLSVVRFSDPALEQLARDQRKHFASQYDSSKWVSATEQIFSAVANRGLENIELA